MYKLSTYNFTTINNDIVHIFSGISGAIIEFPLDIYEEIKKNDLKSISNSDKQTLLKTNILIEGSTDEKHLLNAKLITDKYQKKHLNLTILPTLNCNFACTYCYEHKREIKMSNETIHNIIDFVKNQINSLETLNVTWMGGEPLLGIEEIEHISKKLIHLSNQHNVKYISDIITNGYLINNSNIHILKTNKINKVQITLDGPPEIHDKRRFTKSNKSTFFNIINSIHLLYREKFDITIRINIDDSNVDHIEELLCMINKENLLNINVSFAQVTNDTDACADYGQCITTSQFGLIENKFRKLALNKGFRISSHLNPRSISCGAVMVNNYVINPDGTVVKCWNEIGNSNHSIGNISAGGKLVINNPNRNDYWISYSPIKDSKCKECTILPVCMGGCHWQKENNKCPTIKYIYKKVIDFELNVLLHSQN